jgi:hypothetical protein
MRVLEFKSQYHQKQGLLLWLKSHKDFKIVMLNGRKDAVIRKPSHILGSKEMGGHFLKLI